MVAAGCVFSGNRIPAFLAASEAALMTIAVVGAVTAIFAASIALVQKDIKRVLAYSTISQLGYMMLVFRFSRLCRQAFFHLTTHAFFKAFCYSWQCWKRYSRSPTIRIGVGENGRALEKASCNRFPYILIGTLI